MMRRGSVTLELVVTGLGWGLVLVLLVAFFDASRVRVEIEAERHAMNVGVALSPSTTAQLRARNLASALEETWPKAPEVTVGGSCGDSPPTVEVEALDRSFTSVGVRLSGRSAASSIGAGVHVTEALCTGAGMLSLAEVGGPMRIIDPNWPGSQRSELLEPLF